MKKKIYDLSKRTEQYHWLLNEVLAGIPLEDIAGAFGVSKATISREKNRTGNRPSKEMARLMKSAIELMQDLCSKNGLELSHWTELEFTTEDVQEWLLQQIAFPTRRPPASAGAELHLALESSELTEKLVSELLEMSEGRFIGELEPHEQLDIMRKIQRIRNADLIFYIDLILAGLWELINSGRHLKTAVLVQGITNVARIVETFRDSMTGSDSWGLRPALGLTETPEDFEEKTIRYSREEGSPVLRVRVPRKRPLSQKNKN
jgi:hypothetical protein